MNQHQIWYDDYRLWSANRAALSALEDEPSPPSASQWQRSDDAGIALLESAAAMIEEQLHPLVAAAPAPSTSRVTVACKACGKHLRGHATLDGRYRVLRHKDPKTKRSCPGHLTAGHEPVAA